MLQSLFVILLFVAGATGFGAASPWSVIVHDETSDASTMAIADLQRYLGQVSGSTPRVMTPKEWRKNPRSAVIIGTVKSNEVIAGLDLAPQLENLKDDGFVLAQRRVSEKDIVVAAAASPTGVVNGVYGLLREIGYGFYLGSDAVPDRLPDSLTSETIVRIPVFRIRGVLPWYNFFNSPTTWNPPDHRAFVDQLVRSGANFVGFHTYDKEPFATFEVDGMTTMGERLFNTSRETWGTRAVPTKDFAAGTDKLYSQPYFGADTTLSTKPDSEVIADEQAILREALEYASLRGLKTCLGFEISYDPTEPAERDSFTSRVLQLIRTYPMLDYVWLWQPETQGVQGFRESYTAHGLPGTPSPSTELRTLAEKRREVFNRAIERTAGEPPFFQNDEAGKLARAMEGARLEQYALLAHKLLREHSPNTRLVMSGWGGDERLLSAEYYDGLDKLLPKDVVFASLDHIFPRPRIDKAYHDLPADRERWPIPWLELDGDMWQPQPFVHVYEKLLTDAVQSGSQGILGIHWRTREIEETFGYMMEFAWNGGISAEDYFARLASRKYPSRIAAQMAEVHRKLDLLGYRWVAGGGQSECAEFTWGPGAEDKAAQLERLRTECMGLLQKAGYSRARLQWLIDNMNWVLAYREAELDAVSAKGLLDQAEKETTAAQVMVSEAAAILARGKLERALQAYARRISTRGEYGVLATVNCKAVPQWLALKERCRKLSNTSLTFSSVAAKGMKPAILLPQLLTSAASGSELELMPIIVSGKPAFAHYRRLGDTKWKTVPVSTVRGWVGRVVIPGEAMKSPGVQVGFSFSRKPQQTMEYGPVGVTVIPGPESSIALE